MASESNSKETFCKPELQKLFTMMVAHPLNRALPFAVDAEKCKAGSHLRQLKNGPIVEPCYFQCGCICQTVFLDKYTLRGRILNGAADLIPIGF